MLSMVVRVGGLPVHSKRKGALGEMAVAKVLMRQELPVFAELGDLAKVDLITLVDNHPIRIQVKAFTSVDGKVNIYTTKSGPGYRFRYEEEMFDVFAVYILDKDLVFFVNAGEVLQNSSAITFRLDPPKNNQKGCRFVADYLDFMRALRGHTPNTLTSTDEGEEMVQTTT